jgi:hypothetical protein
MASEGVKGQGTQEDPWILKTLPGSTIDGVSGIR